MQFKSTLSYIEISKLPDHGFKLPMLQQGIKTSGIDIHLHNSVHLIPRLINIKALQWVIIFSFGPLVLFLSGYINKYNPDTGDDSNERGRRSRRGKWKWKYKKKC